ncbi:MAG: hypothetical protein R2728_08870 [Chitinophagales bacterium]
MPDVNIVGAANGFEVLDLLKDKAKLILQCLTLWMAWMELSVPVEYAEYPKLKYWY